MGLKFDVVDVGGNLDSSGGRPSYGGGAGGAGQQQGMSGGGQVE